MDSRKEQLQFAVSILFDHSIRYLKGERNPANEFGDIPDPFGEFESAVQTVRNELLARKWKHAAAQLYTYGEHKSYGKLLLHLSKTRLLSARQRKEFKPFLETLDFAYNFIRQFHARKASYSAELSKLGDQLIVKLSDVFTPQGQKLIGKIKARLTVEAAGRKLHGPSVFPVGSREWNTVHKYKQADLRPRKKPVKRVLLRKRLR
ncbi:MAG: hypothetical protein Q7S92_02975 [Candidatus Diapherotrites archaeon]|nr:hypothetical protein [Candidatus Diapherotrites archaeon]